MFAAAGIDSSSVMEMSEEMSAFGRPHSEKDLPFAVGGLLLLIIPTKKPPVKEAFQLSIIPRARRKGSTSTVP